MNEDDQPRKQATRRDAFVIRIWRESGEPDWLGWVQHAGTGESAAVRRIEELLAFIEQRAGKLGEATRKGIR